MIDPKKAENLIYFMQKQCARDSWADFISDSAGLSNEEADEIFQEIADKLGLDASKFYLSP